MRTGSVTITRLFGAGVSAAIGLGVPGGTCSPDDAAAAGRCGLQGDGRREARGAQADQARSRIIQWDPGASFTLADNETPDQGKSKLVQTRDLAKGLARNEWERPKADGGRRTYVEIVTPTAGYSIGNDAVEGRLPKRTVTDANGQPEHTMSGRRLTATLRELPA